MKNNYIINLQEENKDLKGKLRDIGDEINDFLIFLRSAKFTGTENGQRKDWISTSDVILRLQEIRGKTNY